MSFVAKVFVVFNLLLSGLFFYFAMHTWTAQVKWQKMYEREKAANVVELAEMQKYQVKLAQQVVKSDQRTLAAMSDLAKEKLARDQERDQVLKVQSELTQARNESALNNAERQEVGREKDRLSAELNRARGVVLKIEQALNVERENAVRFKNEKAELEVSYNTLAGQHSAAQRDLKRVEQDLAVMNVRWEKIIQQYGSIPGVDDSQDAAQPAITAQVLAVRADVGLVMISAGSLQGVKPGFRFVISRGSEYIGKVQIDTVYPDMCSAKILPDFNNKNGLNIEIHDVAKTN